MDVHADYGLTKTIGAALHERTDTAPTSPTGSTLPHRRRDVGQCATSHGAISDCYLACALEDGWFWSWLARSSPRVRPVRAARGTYTTIGGRDLSSSGPEIRVGARAPTADRLVPTRQSSQLCAQTYVSPGDLNPHSVRGGT